MHRFARIVLAAALSLTAAPALPAADPLPQGPMVGFTTGRAAEQRAFETRFDSFLRPEDQRDWMKRLTARPHPVGSPHGKENADFMAGLFRSWGYETRIEEFKVLFPTPRLRHLEMTAPVAWTAMLDEPPLGPDAAAQEGQLPPYNAYSADGDATGDLVYVNYGMAQDYEDLERHGIDVKGKIVLARYGRGFRGAKPKLAATHGAVACLLFDDPRADGFAQGDVYPAGGWRPEQGVQRGSVADSTLYSGDPLTPFVGATTEARRLPREEAPTIARIPVLPISAANALALLRALRGAVAPEEWRGGLPVTYRLGPGPARIHLALAFDWSLVPAYDVIARLTGAADPDEWFLRGNHHDAWVNGASDPVSAMVALLAEARAVGELARTGWRPRRTIVYAAWDGEEAALLGSVEWAETHAKELTDHLAAYVNSDGNARGFAATSGSPSLATLVDQVYRDVRDPETGASVEARARAAALLWGPPALEQAAREGKPLPLLTFSVGTDFTPFLNLGAASLDTSYGGEEEYGTYHSAYDTMDHFTRFVDPGFVYGVTQAQTAGRIVLRLAGADVLPFDFVPLADALGRSIRETSGVADSMREDTATENRRIAEGIYALTDDPKQHLPAPKPKDPVPPLDFAPLEKAVARLAASAAAYDAAMSKANAAGFALSAAAGARLDHQLMQCERALTRPEGLPRRSWYRHQIWGPVSSRGVFRPLPGVREAIEQRNWTEATEQVAVAAGVIETLAQQVDRAAAALGPAATP